MDLKDRLPSCNIIDIRTFDRQAYHEEAVQYKNPFLQGEEKEEQERALQEVFDRAVARAQEESPLHGMSCRGMEEPKKGLVSAFAALIMGGGAEAAPEVDEPYDGPLLDSIREYGRMLTKHPEESDAPTVDPFQLPQPKP